MVRIAVVVSLSLLVGAGLALIALGIGSDRVVPCQERAGLDQLLGDQLGHIDGPSGGGGCIVPTPIAWTGAAVVFGATIVVGTVAATRIAKGGP
jgi:hypothetical protein